MFSTITQRCLRPPIAGGHGVGGEVVDVLLAGGVVAEDVVGRRSHLKDQNLH